ncbi:AAA family ATPase [Gracilibacillus massiliensis]|uniref:AAA family ATPase n=1 Tax=Gracilibacillus massiliensis TaxID=1564956 RepID=UPI00071D7D7E|nr:AAA family ATPase [Gracilibacillus massiliensis]
MKKLRLVLFDPDMEYIELFTNYIRSSEHAARFDVKSFSQEGSFQQYIENGEQTDILLKATNDFHLNEEHTHIETTLHLVEETPENSTEKNLFKYQPLGQLITQVIAFHYERNGKKEKKKMQSSGETSVISVYSASGGAGKTTTAFHLANEMKQNGLEVFYLNLELINTNPFLFNVEDKSSSSPLLYYLKSNKDQLPSKLEDMIVVDDDTSIPFFYFLPSAEEMMDLNEQEIQLLIEQLVALQTYDYIVIDLDSTINSTVLTALKKSDHVLWLLSNDMYSFYKTSYLLEELHGFLNDGSFSDRVTLVLNRYTGAVDPKLADTAVEIDSYLPYIPEWKQLVSKEQLNNPVFAEYVEKLMHTFQKVGV